MPEGIIQNPNVEQAAQQPVGNEDVEAEKAEQVKSLIISAQESMQKLGQIMNQEDVVTDAQRNKYAKIVQEHTNFWAGMSRDVQRTVQEPEPQAAGQVPFNAGPNGVPTI